MMVLILMQLTRQGKAGFVGACEHCRLAADKLAFLATVLARLCHQKNMA